jgi:hypothetical protein
MVPFAPGGPTAIVAWRMSASLGQQVVVGNVAGAAGTTGAARVSRTEPDGRLSAAMLDVADPGPRPSGNPFWQREKIILTPHSASRTHPETAVRFLRDTIVRHQRGEALRGLVDRARGY